MYGINRTKQKNDFEENNSSASKRERSRSFYDALLCRDSIVPALTYFFFSFLLLQLPPLLYVASHVVAVYFAFTFVAYGLPHFTDLLFNTSWQVIGAEPHSNLF